MKVPTKAAMKVLPRDRKMTEVRVWCVLNQNTVEEAMFDVVSTKQSAADLCLKGQPIPHDYHPVEPGEVMAVALQGGRVPAEDQPAADAWESLRTRFTALASVPAWLWR